MIHYDHSGLYKHYKLELTIILNSPKSSEFTLGKTANNASNSGKVGAQLPITKMANQHPTPKLPVQIHV